MEHVQWLLLCLKEEDFIYSLLTDKIKTEKITSKIEIFLQKYFSQ